MPSINVEGLDKALLELKTLGKAIEKDICGKALYAGTEIIADKLKESIMRIPTQDGWPKPGEFRRGPSRYHRGALRDHMGVSAMQKDRRGVWNIKVGFDGYADMPHSLGENVTKRWPYGQPVPMLARAVESGTSFMAKNPFVEPTAARYGAEAEAAMIRVINEEIEKISR